LLLKQTGSLQAIVRLTPKDGAAVTTGLTMTR